jgi:hypothetical protein
MLRTLQGRVYNSIIKLQPAVARREYFLRSFSDSARDPSKASKFSDEETQTKSMQSGASPLSDASSRPSRIEHKVSMTADEFLWDDDDENIGSAMAAMNSVPGHSHVQAQPRGTVDTSSKTPDDSSNTTWSSAWPSFKVNDPSKPGETAPHHHIDRHTDVSAKQAPIQGSDVSPSRAHLKDQSAGMKSEVATKQAPKSNNSKENQLPWETMTLKERKRMHETFLRSRVLSLYRCLFVVLCTEQMDTSCWSSISHIKMYHIHDFFSPMHC